jgi:hypothetical protein
MMTEGKLAVGVVDPGVPTGACVFRGSEMLVTEHVPARGATP